MLTKRELSVRQIRWLILLKDDGIRILYHPGKANVVVEYLSRLSLGSTTHL